MDGRDASALVSFSKVQATSTVSSKLKRPVFRTRSGLIGRGMIRSSLGYKVPHGRSYGTLTNNQGTTRCKPNKQMNKET